MSDILLAVYSESLGHAGRSRQIGELLRRCGLRVHFAGGGCFDHIFEEPVLSSPIVPYPLLGDWLRAYLPGLPFFQAEPLTAVTRVAPSLALDALTTQWIRLLELQKPDVIVADGRPELFWAAAELRIPLIGVMSYVWTNHYYERYERTGATVDIDRERDTSLLRRFNAVGIARHLNPVVDCWAPFRGTKSVIPDTRAFVAGAIERALTIGAQIWSPPENATQMPFPRRHTKRPMVYVTSGSSRFSLLPEVARQLSARGANVVLTGDVRHTQRTPGSDGRVFHWPGLAPGAALAAAADVIVCHGGSQTLYQAARAGTFAYVTPQHFDHERNGRLFARHGFAAVIPRTTEVPSIADRVMERCQSGMHPPRLTAEPPVDPTALCGFLATS